MNAKTKIVAAPEAAENLARFTLFTCDPPHVLSKTWKLVDGKLVKTAQGGVMTYGDGEVIAVEDLSGLAEVLACMGPRNAASWGTPRHDVEPGEVFRVVTDARAPETVAERGTKMFSRTRDHYHFPKGKRTIWMVDIDGRAPGKPNPRTAQEVRAMICAALPELDDVEMLVLSSGSAHIYDAATGQELRGNTGWRIYVIVEDGSDIPRLGERLFAELWLMGEGYIKVSSSGAKLERALVDKSVNQPERLDFIGGANLGDGLIQKRPPPVLIPGAKKTFDSRTVPDLTAEEAEEYAQLIEAAKAAIEPEAAKLRAEAVTVQTGRRVKVLREKLSREPTEDEVGQIEAAVRAQLSAASGVLSGDHVLEVRLGGRWTPVAVADILADPDRFVGCRTRDPFDPTDGDHGGAGSICRSRDGKVLTVTSFARGQEITYTLTTTAPVEFAEVFTMLGDKLREAARSRGGEDEVARIEAYWAARAQEEAEKEAARERAAVEMGLLGDLTTWAIDLGCDGLEGWDRMDRMVKNLQARFLHFPRGKADEELVCRFTGDGFNRGRLATGYNEFAMMLPTGEEYTTASRAGEPKLKSVNPVERMLAPGVSGTERIGGFQFVPGCEDRLVPFVDEDRVPRPNDLRLNLYKPPRFDVPAEARLDADEVGAGFRGYLRHLIEDEGGGDWMHDWIAFKTQRPAERGTSPVLVTETQGTGRNTLIKMLRGVLGGSNVGDASAKRLFGGQSDFHDVLLNRALITCDEVLVKLDASHAERSAMTEALKRLVDPYPQYRTWSRKLMSDVEGWDFTSFIWASNHPAAALPLPAGDRRFAVWQCTRTKMIDAPAEVQQFKDWLLPRSGEVNAAGLEALRRYLLSVDVSGFDFYNAPVTDAKDRMIEAGKSEVDEVIETFIATQLEPGQLAFRLKDMISWCEGRLSDRPYARLKVRDVARRKALGGFTDADGLRWWFPNKDGKLRVFAEAGATAVKGVVVARELIEGASFEDRRRWLRISDGEAD